MNRFILLYDYVLLQWLDLSINKNVPISLLILSRAFTLESKVGPHSKIGRKHCYEAFCQLKYFGGGDCPSSSQQFTDPATAVADSISSLDQDVVNEVRP